MSPRKRSKVAPPSPPSPRPPTTVAPPFHSPFSQLKDTWKPPPPAVRPAAIPAATTTAKSAPAQAPKLALPPKPLPTEAETLRAALDGVAPLKPSPARVFVRRQPKAAAVSAARLQQEAAAKQEFAVTWDGDRVRGRAGGVNNELLRQLERGEFVVSAQRDLHGMIVEDARRAVDDFLAQQQELGVRCVRLVTGQGKNSVGGRGVLREQVPQWLSSPPSARRVLAFASASRDQGGIGALVVLMRAKTSSKN